MPSRSYDPHSQSHSYSSLGHNSHSTSHSGAYQRQQQPHQNNRSGYSPRQRHNSPGPGGHRGGGYHQQDSGRQHHSQHNGNGNPPPPSHQYQAQTNTSPSHHSHSHSHNHNHHNSGPPPPPAPSSPITQVSRTAPVPTPQMLMPQLPPDFVPPEPDPSTFTPLLPPKAPRFQNRNTLVLDLDETLVHSDFEPVPGPDIVIDIELEGRMHTVYVKKRPYVEEFLRRMSQIYEVVILTASLEVYADPLLDRLDKGNWIHHRLFRDSCANLNGNYIKDLSYLGRPLHQTIIVDNSPIAYLFQPRNALAITSWFDDLSDRELWDMMPSLERASYGDNVLPALSQARSELENQQPLTQPNHSAGNR